VIVVSDTSPLNYLAMLGKLSLLPQLFERVLIPSAVERELRHGGQTIPAIHAIWGNDWLEVRKVQNGALVEELKGEIDEGEAEAIALALESSVSLLLVDELDGRRVASQRGLVPVGLGGLLVQAKLRGLIASVREDLDWLRSNTSFHLSEPTYREILQYAGE
jgi:predicted nucleic acid-binding protein